jgi:hypothetical protein
VGDQQVAIGAVPARLVQKPPTASDRYG